MKSGDLNFIKTCVVLLQRLSVWLTDAYCQHYFIDNCNLINKTSGAEMVISQLQSVDKVSLSTWFVKRYIRNCSKHSVV